MIAPNIWENRDSSTPSCVFPLETTTFDNFAVAVTELLDHLGVRERFIYLHDFGAPVGFRIAMDHPELVRGLIVSPQNTSTPAGNSARTSGVTPRPETRSSRSFGRRASRAMPAFVRS